MKITTNLLAKLTAAGVATSSLFFFNIAPASAELVPNCVTTSLDDRGFTDHLIVKNGCTKSVRVKVVIANFKGDAACRTFVPKKTIRYEWKYPGRFDRLEAC